MKARSVFFAALAAVLGSSVHAVAQDAGIYKLGVQDRVRVYVHEWPVLTGEFVVGANGTLTLPLLGTIPASGLTPADVAAELGERLREKAKLSGPPDTTIDIVQYRPFYILGGVERPGEYNFRAGMLVVNAVAIAGGIYRPPRASDWGFERDAITGRGDLRLGSVRSDELKVKEIRLKAEAEDLAEFPALPPDLSPAALKYVEEEKLVFSARRDRHKNQLTSIAESISLLEGEIHGLQGQLTAAGKQENSVNRELEDTRGLVARSLTPAPRILPIERTLAQIEREKKEIETNIIRVRQQINTLKGQRNALIDERRSIALVELQSLDAQRRELNEKIETASRLISGSASMLPRRDESETEATPVFVIIRQIEGKPVELPAVETTVIHPGDIVKVYRAHDVGSSGRSSSSLSDQKLSIEARGK